MSQTNLNIAPETTPPPEPKGLPCVQLPCPKCGEPCANISLHLWTLDDPMACNFTCEECEGEISLDDVRGFIRAWTRMLAWLEAIPTPATE